MLFYIILHYNNMVTFKINVTVIKNIVTLCTCFQKYSLLFIHTYFYFDLLNVVKFLYTLSDVEFPTLPLFFQFRQSVFNTISDACALH
jgi:hypothetical protein